MSAPQAPGAGVEISLRIGQRVRHSDYQGQRVTGVVDGLSVQDRALMVDIVLDAPIVIPAMGEYGPTKIYRQHVPAHELAPFDERDELIAEMLVALVALERVTTAAVYAKTIGQEQIALVDCIEPASKARDAIAKANGGAA